MPELQNILGAIFRDIAQSVFASDMYSRDISQYYEQDPLLRHFPIPRTEIDELEVDLKFGITNIAFTRAQTVGREASAAPAFIDFSYDLSESLFEGLANNLAKRNDIAGETWRKVNSIEYRIYLRQDILKFFQRNQGSLIQDGELQVRQARDELSGLLRNRLGRLIEDTKTMSASERKRLIDATLREVKLEEQLKQLQGPLQSVWEAEGDYTLDVEITADRLQEMAPETLASVHVRTRVRNYLWSEVEHEGRRWWSLNPE